MAIKAIIATQFDATGLKNATKQFEGLGKTIRSTLGAVGLTVGIGAIVGTLKDASKAAIEDTKSQALLAQQLRNSVDATDAAIAGSEAFISSLQLQTSIADDTLRPALARLVLSTGSLDQAQKLLALSTNIAAGTGKDLGAVSAAVAKAAAGQTTQLFRLIPSLRGSADWAAQAAMEFDGMAEAAANNDPYQRLNVIFGEIQEQIGMALMPELNALADYFASPQGQKELQGYASLMKELAGVFIFVGTTVAEFLAGFKVVGAAFGKLFSGDFAGFIELMNSRGMVDALAKLDGIGTSAAATANKTINLNANIGSTTTSSRTTGTTKKTPAQIAAEKAAEALAKATEALAGFKKELKELTIAPMVQVTRELGQFEQATVDAFSAISDKLNEGILNKTISAKGAQALLSYIKVEKVALEALNRQRDDLITKRGLAETLIADVKSAITGVGALAGLLETQTRQVTTSVSSVVNGFSVTTKRTVEEVVGGSGVLSKLQAVVTKTKAFAGQLTDLKKLGLNADLFKQIVEAGPDVGGQLAKEILDGGADSVKALNTTFTELQDVAGGIAEQTAVVMYNAGIDVAGGLVNGLLAQEAAIVSAANQLAAAFNAAYQSQIGSLTIPEVPKAPVVTPKVTSNTKIIAPKITVKATPATKASAQATVAAVKKFYGSNSVQGRSALFS